MSDKFFQFHMLNAYGPSNLNRDDTGRPKTCIVGGSPRIRVSSQSLKRAWRTGEEFSKSMKGHLGERTRLVGKEILKAIPASDDGTHSEHTLAAVDRVLSRFGAVKVRAEKIEQLVFVSREELDAAVGVSRRIVAGEKVSDSEVDAVLGNAAGAVDIAMFGRMLAATPVHNVEAAVQVAHAFTTHRSAVEDDYYVAVDDLNTDADTGAGFLDVQQFGSGIFYSYVCVDRNLLLENLRGNRELAAAAFLALKRAMVTTGPKAKAASYASHSRPFYVLAESGDEQPRSLATAFVKAVAGDDMLRGSIDALKSTRDAMDRVYGSMSTRSVEMDVLAGTGSMSEYEAFDV